MQYAQGEIPAVAQGDSVALRIDYTVRRVAGRTTEPSVMINTAPIERIPAVISKDFAQVYRGTGQGAAHSGIPPLTVGDQRDLAIDVGPGTILFGLSVVDVVDEFPTLQAYTEQIFMIVPLEVTRALINQQAANSAAFFDTNQVWLDLPERQPTSKLEQELEQIPGQPNLVYAWDRFGQIQREPLPSAVAGMLFIGFWVSLGLSLLDFAFYVVVTAKQRSFTFGVLRSLGWNTNNIWRLLLIENVTLVTPALLIGTLLGAGLAYLLLPFLSLVGSATLRFHPLEVFGMIMMLVVGFSFLLTITATWLRRMSVNQVLRLGEE
jgi:ABC-type lipoprotein release transport system permease subunit